MAAAPAPRAAMTPPRRRAWLRVFVVRYGLPCDPPVGGHSCNGRMITRFHRAVCRSREPSQRPLGLKHGPEAMSAQCPVCPKGDMAAMRAAKAGDFKKPVIV